MKKILSSIALLLLATITFASNSVTVQNNTSYTIYIRIHVSDDNTDYCRRDETSNVLTIASNSSTVYDFTTNVPSGITATSGFFTGAIVYQGNPSSCGLTNNEIGNPCIAAPYVPGAHFFNSSCASPKSANIFWSYPSYTNTILTIQ